MSGWNGSDRRGNSAPVQPNAKAKKPSPVRGLIAGAVVAALGAAVWFVLFNEEPSASPQEKRTSKTIKTVTPATKAESPKGGEPKAVATVATAEAPKMPNPDAPAPAKKLVMVPKVVTNAYQALGPKSLVDLTFSNRTDRSIARLVLAEPGLPMIGRSDGLYGPDFEKAFKESLKKPIVIDPNDSAEVVELKQIVMEARQEIKARVDAGESVSDIMTQTRDELQELFRYKNTVQREVEKHQASEGVTAASLEDIVTAANQLLEAQGIPKLKMPKTMIRRLLIEEGKAKEEDFTERNEENEDDQ